VSVAFCDRPGEFSIAPVQSSAILRLHERLARGAYSNRDHPSADDREAEALVAWWVKRYFLGKRGALDKHLHAIGIPLEALSGLLHHREVNGAPADIWLNIGLAQNDTAADRNALRRSSSLYGLDHLCAAFTQAAASAVSRALERDADLGTPKIDVQSVMRDFAGYLERRLTALLMPALLVEANLHRLNSNTNETAVERLRSFAGMFEQEDRQERFWRKYPVLRRLAATVTGHSAKAAVDAIERIRRDWRAIADRFGLPPGDGLKSIRWGGGDSHDGGKVVAILGFSTANVVYKPRPMGIDIAYDSFLEWYSSVAIEPSPARYRILNMGDYGYAEFIHHGHAGTVDDVKGFYHRLGQLVCIAWVLGITDLHHENLIASATDPYLVDVEAAAEKPVAVRRKTKKYENGFVRAFQAFLFGTGLLPIRMKGSDGVVDMSAIGSLSEQATPKRRPQIEGYGRDDARLVAKQAMMPRMQNAPDIQGGEVRPIDFLGDIVAGFECARALLVRHAAAVEAPEGPLRPFESCRVRWVGRQTQDYADLIEKAAHPSVARDAAECDMLFGGSLRSTLRFAPHLERVIGSEMTCLWNGDIPYFWTTPGSVDLHDARGSLYDGFFAQDAMTGIRWRLANLEGLRDVHAAALEAAVGSTVGLKTGPFYEPVPAVASDGVGDGDFLKLGTSIADRLLKEIVRIEGMPYGVGLMPLEVEEYAAVVLPPDVYDGVPGIGIFFGYLGQMTGKAEYLKFASNVRTLIRRLIREKAGAKASGAFNGLAGLIYADLHISACLGLPPSAESSHALARLEGLASRDGHFDIISGASGALLVALRFHASTGDARALAVARAAARRLAATAEHQAAGIAWHTLKNHENRLGGLAHGVSGIAWALCEWNRHDQREEWQSLVRGAYAFEQSLFEPELGTWKDVRIGTGAPTCFWCYGAPGIGLAVNGMRDVLGDRACDDALRSAADVTWRFGFVNSHCLCHGNLGNAELFRATGDHRRARRLVEAAAADFRSQGVWKCGLPANATTPGLMCGLAGIGYGLLRERDPLIPNLLLLEGPPSELQPGSAPARIRSRR
jgi:type 2 lantibiotic biosynthesis protein LanM